MHKSEAPVFTQLFRDACHKCFGNVPTGPLTEAESNHFSDVIEEQTRLLLGWKSLKNYSHYVFNKEQPKPVNPSHYSLEVLARYVAGVTAPIGKKQEIRKGQYPYWFKYKETVPGTGKQSTEKTDKTGISRRTIAWLTPIAALAIIIVLLVTLLRPRIQPADFVDNFSNVTDDALTRHGWFIKDIDHHYWTRRAENPGQLSLFTLPGDNWPTDGIAPGIKNLLLREIPFECFVAELHLSDFFPQGNWQQAGLLVLEDTTYTGKSLRLSLGYNDYTGGFGDTREIIIQAVTSLGSGFANPEEIAHHRIFNIGPDDRGLLLANLTHSALRIEKKGNRFRLLYSCSPVDNYAFHNVTETNFEMQPRYIGIFALKGFVKETDVMTVKIDHFSLMRLGCK